MKRNLVLLTLTLLVPLVFLVFVSTGLFIFYMVFGNTDNNSTENAEVIRIRTISNLEADTESQTVEEPVVLVEAAESVEVPAKSIVTAPTLVETTDDTDQVFIDPLPVENDQETEDVVEIAPVPDESVITAPPVTEPNPTSDLGLSQEVEDSPLTIEEPSVIKIPAEPVKIEQRPVPEVVAKPVPSSDNSSPQADQAESSFVPGSSFFDQLLDQVE